MAPQDMAHISNTMRHDTTVLPLCLLASSSQLAVFDICGCLPVCASQAAQGAMILFPGGGSPLTWGVH